MATYTNLDLSFPRELQGSGQRVFSKFNTTDFIVVRMYVQSASSYKPLPLNSVDPRYKGAYMVEENEDKRDGYAVWFTRKYATIPTTRIDHRIVTFTVPGVSSRTLSFSKATGFVLTWDKYGQARPATLSRNASVNITYSLGEPATTAPTVVTYAGSPVDFTGTVYADDGTTFLGTTDPISPPGIYVISDVARRWMGNIWEREYVSVGTGGGVQFG